METIYIICRELNDRFTNNNDILLAISDSSKMTLLDLLPLQPLGLKMPPEEELNVCKKYMDKKKRPGSSVAIFRVGVNLGKSVWLCSVA